MKRNFKLTAIFSLLLTMAFSITYLLTSNGFLLTLSITFGTIAYHLCMRLVVGGSINAILKNKINYKTKWFRVSVREREFYAKIGVKKWKGKMPTYNPSTFNPSENTWAEIAMATCQAEIVHEIIVLLSFLPIIFAKWFGALAVFLVTSVLSALVDLCFVIIQRFNRPRIIRLIKQEKNQ